MSLLSGLMAEYMSRNWFRFQHLLSQLQATVSKSLTYSLLRPTQPPSLSWMENSSATERRPTAVVVCLHDALQVQLSISMGNPWLLCCLYAMPVSCSLQFAIVLSAAQES